MTLSTAPCCGFQLIRITLFVFFEITAMLKARAEIPTSGCLFATTVGDGAEEVSVGSCHHPDPLELARNPQVLKLIAAIGVKPELISFSGCPGNLYALRLEAGGRYVVTYPPEIKDGFLAPVAHELAHIVQSEAAGGYVKLIERYRSRRIELGADYVAGILFRQVLPEASRNIFQNHVKLKGLYRESLDGAHGTPNQRTSAFRMGVVGRIQKTGAGLAESSEHFQEDIYARIVLYSD